MCSKTRKAIFIMFGLCLASESIAEVSYDKFISSYMNSSSIIKVKTNKIRSIEVKERSAKNYYSPIVNVTTRKKIFGDDVSDFQIDTSINSTLYSVDSFSGISIQKTAVLIARNELEDTLDTDILSINKNLISIYFSERLDELSKQLENSDKKLLSDMENKQKFGLVPKRELDQAKLLNNKIHSERKILNKQIEKFKNNIELVTEDAFPTDGIKIDSGWVTDLLNNVTVGGYDVNSLSNNIKLQKINLEIENSRLAIKQANPILNVSFEATNKYYENSVDSSGNDIYGGLVFSFNIFDLNKVDAEKSKVIDYETMIFQRDVLSKSLMAEVNKLEIEYSSDSEKLKDLKSQEKLNEDIVMSYEKDYDLGGVSFFELSRTKYDLYLLKKDIATLNIKIVSNRLELENLYNLNEHYIN
ncbi:TolC family protein [Vibrio fluvialis]|nr:TolC family protein [Vibrio fluvialis]